MPPPLENDFRNIERASGLHLFEREDGPNYTPGGSFGTYDPPPPSTIDDRVWRVRVALFRPHVDPSLFAVLEHRYNGY